MKIRLPNNRWVRGHLAPAAARRDDLAALRRNIALNTKRAFAAIRENARAIDELAHAQQQLANIVAELQARGELSLLRDLVGRVEGLDQRVQVQQQALTTHSQSVSRQQGSLRKALNRQVRSARIQKLNAVATSMQVAAYGSKGNPLARNNLMLAGNELLWSFIGDLLRGFGIAGPGEISPLGWLAPVASLATGRVALGRQQHQRFLSGVATFPPPTDKTTLLRVTLDIADALWPSFRHRDDVPVTAIPLEPNSNAPVKGFVRDGVLLLVLSNALEFDDVRVAWMVDTGVGDG